MERFYTGQFLGAVGQYSRTVGQILERRIDRAVNPPLEKEVQERLFSSLEGIEKSMRGVALSEVMTEHLKRIKGYLKADSTFPIAEESALYITKDFLENLETEFRTHLFFFVSSSRKQMYTEPDAWFWGEITQRVRGAEADIEEACRCHALGRPTATVTHLMRIAEIGLRALARTASVTVKKKDRNVPHAWADWQDLITAIRAKKVTGLQTPRGAKRSDELDFYQGALGEFEAFKDAYRNHVMHARRIYKDPDAEHVMLYVRGFMRRLAPRVR